MCADCQEVKHFDNYNGFAIPIDEIEKKMGPNS